MARGERGGLVGSGPAQAPGVPVGGHHLPVSVLPSLANLKIHTQYTSKTQIVIHTCTQKTLQYSQNPSITKIGLGFYKEVGT